MQELFFLYLTNEDRGAISVRKRDYEVPLKHLDTRATQIDLEICQFRDRGLRGKEERGNTVEIRRRGGRGDYRSRFFF